MSPATSVSSSGSLLCSGAFSRGLICNRPLPRFTTLRYFPSTRAGAKLDSRVLSSRLACFDSRLPKLRKKKSMSFEELVAALSRARDTIDDELVEDELGPLVSVEERAGLALRIKAALAGVIEGLSSGLAGD